MKEVKYSEGPRERACGRDVSSQADLWEFADTALGGWIPNSLAAGKALWGLYFQPPSNAASFPARPVHDERSRVLAPRIRPSCHIQACWPLCCLSHCLLYLFYVAQSVCLAVFQNCDVKHRHGKSHRWSSQGWSPSCAVVSVVFLCSGMGCESGWELMRGDIHSISPGLWLWLYLCLRQSDSAERLYSSSQMK